MPARLSLLLIVIACLSIGALVGMLLAPQGLSAAKEPDRFTPPKIAYVNIAKVMRQFNRANVDSRVIAAKRQEWIDKAKPLAETLAQKSREIQGAVNPAEIEAFKKEAQDLQARLEEMNKQAQKELTEITDSTLVALYTDIRLVIADLAERRGLDVVECYPDGSNPEDEKKAVVAQLKLQTPGLFPFYLRKQFDITDDVIAALNKAPSGKGALDPPFTK